ncbi:gluconokinase [Catenovulum sp. 2E275]|uniref:gluconokinase n=1 Tax=Catenovulum sp. 2E275 TaxID=2980497 RepID=UPI0021CFCAA9|nr:gluconokinase [Catenovulum sp. 2E275]MCU4674030.1 gluconokinase [Catenovulum sp. 2E275]
MILIIGGVSGTGKSTIGQLLANRLNLPFYDADDFHPHANLLKMNKGIPLNDSDRQPWLETLSSQISVWAKDEGAVLACSALKQSYRQTLSSQCRQQINWVMLNGSKQLLMQRLKNRKGHFFKPALLTSQLDTLELPEYGLVMDIAQQPEVIINQIVDSLNEK